MKMSVITQAVRRPAFRRRLRTSAAAALLCGGSGLAAPVFAQADFPAPGQTRGGPEMPVSSAVFSLSARAESNVPRTSENAVGLTGLERSDVSLFPAVQLNLARPIGRHRIGLRSTLGYQVYLRNPELNSENIEVAPFADLRLGPCALGLEGRVSRRQSSLADIAYLFVNDPTFAIDNRETVKRAAAALSCGAEYGLQPRLDVSYDEGANSNALRRFSNFRSTRVSPGLAYASPGLGEVSVYAVKQDTKLPNQIDSLTGQPDGYEIRGGGVRYRRAVGTRLTFDGRLSYVSLDPDGAGDGTDGTNYAVDLTFAVPPRLQFIASASREFTSQLSGFADYEIVENYSLTANYAANARLRLMAGGMISPRRLFFDTPPQSTFTTEQTVHTIFAGASYELNRRVQLRLDTGYERRSSNVPIFDFDNYYVSAGVSFSL